MIRLQTKKFGRLLEIWSKLIKAFGFDEICGYFKSIFWKHSSTFCYKTIEQTLRSERFPSRLVQMCYYTTVQKGDDINPDNYKGISLLKDKSKVGGDFWHALR